MKDQYNNVLPKDAHLIPKEANLVFKGDIFSVYQWKQELYNGSKTTFEMLKRSNTVIIVPLLGGEKVLVINEDQPSGVVRRDYFPSGRVEPNESPLEAAKRELKEETGYQFRDWKLLSIKQPANKIEWFVYTYVACEQIGDIKKQRLDPGEKILPVIMSWKKIWPHAKNSISELKSFHDYKKIIDFIKK